MAAGFSPNKKPGTKDVIPDRAIMVKIEGHIIGDSLICLRKALKKLNVKYVECTMTDCSGMIPVERPFMHYTLPGGLDIPFGAYSIEGLGTISPTATGRDAPELSLTLRFNKNVTDESLWDEIVAEVYKELSQHLSIFKSAAVKLTTSEDLIVPNFMNIDKDLSIFLNRAVEEEVENNLFFPIHSADKLKQHGIGGQRGVILHGNYGTGKTLIAYKAARLSAKQGRTFILSRADMMRSSIAISRFLQPSTLFVEDMDCNALSFNQLSILRNSLSGVDGKVGHDVIMILTTNFIEEVKKADRSLLRPDRIDSIINITPPDSETAQRILEHFGNEWLSGGDWVKVCEEIEAATVTPAILVEILKRCKVEAIRSSSKISPGVFRKYMTAMEAQINLADPKPPAATNTPEHKLASGLREVLGG